MDGDRVVGLNGFCEVRKVFLVLFPQVVVYKLVMSVFKDFKVNIVINIICGCNIDSLSLFLLTFVDLLTNVCHTVQYMMGGRGLIVFCKGG